MIMPLPSLSPLGRSPDATSLTITSNDVVQGCVLWLGDEKETFRSYQMRNGKAGSPVVNTKTRLPANAGMFGHPVVVVSRPSSDPNTIFFHQITSLAGRTLAERFSGRKAAYRQQTFCPVDPAPPHPQFASNKRYRTLTLENGDALEKASFVNVREVYQMDWRDAQLYWGADPTTRKPWKLDAISIASLKTLTSMTAKFKIEPQYRPRTPPPNWRNDQKSEEVLLLKTTPPHVPNPSSLIQPTPVLLSTESVFTEPPKPAVPAMICDEKESLLPIHYDSRSQIVKRQRAASWLGALLSWRIWPPQLWAFLRLLLCRTA